MFTDNSTAEAAFAKGSSSSRLLSDLVLKLRLAAIQFHFLLRVIHVAGTCMIMQGTDALSQGELHVGSLISPAVNAVPLHLAPCQRCPFLYKWVIEWAPDVTLATPNVWVGRAHIADSIFLWDLPPGAAAYALEEIGMIQTKRCDKFCAIVTVPCLLRPTWLRLFCPQVDVYFTVPPSHPFWPKSMHEPLLVGICLPLLKHEPWSWLESPGVVGFGRKVSALLKDDHGRARDILRKFWLSTKRIPHLPAGVVRKLLHSNQWQRLLGVSSCG